MLTWHSENRCAIVSIYVRDMNILLDLSPAGCTGDNPPSNIEHNNNNKTVIRTFVVVFPIQY